MAEQGRSDTVGRYLKLSDTLFDGSPINVGGFELRSHSAVPVERPSMKDWQEAFIFANATERASPYWVGDLLAYSDSRPDWREKMDQALSVSNLSKQTLLNRAVTSRKVTGRARELAPSITHAAVVQSLDPDEQEELLGQAQAEEWTVSELTRAKKRKERTVRAEGAALTMHTVDVTVRLTREAATGTHAEDAAWAAVRAAIAGIPHAKVIGARAFPAVGPLRVVKRGRTTAKAV